MVLKTMRKVKLFLLITTIFIFSCEDQGLIVKCPDCRTDEPKQTDLEVKLDSEIFGNLVLIKVYEGNLEDSVLYYSVSVPSSSTTISVTINKKYTLTATYHIGDNYYTAVDSATPRVRYEKDLCDNPCYFLYDRTIDLRLKYTK
jgi:hypothetical protein